MTRAAALGISLLTLVLPLSGCDVSITRDDDDVALPPAATDSDGTEVWDLRSTPAPEDVGIVGDEVAVYETRPERPILLQLPDGVELRLPARYLAFRATDDTVSIDVKTGTRPLDETVELLGSVLDQLALPAETVATFEAEAGAATGTEWVRADRVPAQLGDLDLGVVARYSPHGEAGLVAVSGGWQL
ncbi:hypothetical protein [Jiangella sp. DSM 45060]|uniref:hypothetical protein n=1 Tax=Jiangella sp. DSM 45060 TaxID=1798224 RepID=UPI00087A8744|nr:hypothetical protein [Jiangella sp. DSM 45060]SDS49345.1 hypothetical protein SAMN04515669_1220 [Jiangella sp. DSM 45060]